MRLKKKFIDHGAVDVTNLLAAIPHITDEHWFAWKTRNEPTIPFLYMPNFTPPHLFYRIRKYSQPKWLEDIVYPIGEEFASRFNGKILKLMLIAVEPDAVNGNFHTDPSETLTKVHRCHMPLIKSDLTRYHVGGEEFDMEVGHWYEKDNTLTHAVVNYSEPRQRRVSLQCDVFPLDESRFQRFPEYYPRESDAIAS